MTQNESYTVEIRVNVISLGRRAFEKVKTLLTARIPIEMKKIFTKSFILSAVLYSSEIWTIKNKEERYLQSFEMLVEKNDYGELD